MLNEYGYPYLTSKIIANDEQSIIKIHFSDGIRYMPRSYAIHKIHIFEHVQKPLLNIPCSIDDFENILTVLNTDVSELEIRPMTIENISTLLDIMGLLGLSHHANFYFKLLNNKVFEKCVNCNPNEYLRFPILDLSYCMQLCAGYKAVIKQLDEIKHFKPDTYHIKQINRVIKLIEQNIEEEGFNIDKYIETLQEQLLQLCT